MKNNEEIIKEWMEYAISDLELAKKGKVSKKVRYYSLCFHAQQSVEKAIKALLIHYGIPFPKTHNIAHLLKLLKENDKDVPKAIIKAQILTDYAADSRYPGDFEEISLKEYKVAVPLAEKVMKWVTGIIYKSPNKLF